MAHTMAQKTIYLEVNKKVNGEYTKVGTIEVPCFDLSAFGLNVEATGVDDEGVPTYGTDAINWVMGAVWAATKADARNKLVSGTANVKPGQKIASTIEELIAKAERNGEALQINREFLQSFAAYLAQHSGKKEAVQALYNSMAKNRQTIALSSEQRREGLLAQITAYAEQASAEDAQKFAGILTSISEACQGEEALDDSDL